LYWARINRIYYGNSVQDAAAIGFDDEFFCRQLKRAPQDRKIQEIQLLAREARRVFHDFSAKPDSVRY
jgi:tRNA(Arg) A34 adenosine deaminase TadA